MSCELNWDLKHSSKCLANPASQRSSQPIHLHKIDGVVPVPPLATSLTGQLPPPPRSLQMSKALRNKHPSCWGGGGVVVVGAGYNPSCCYTDWTPILYRLTISYRSPSHTDFTGKLMTLSYCAPRVRSQTTMLLTTQLVASRGASYRYPHTAYTSPDVDAIFD